MADTKNVYEQLEELKEKLNEANKPRTLVEQLANNDPAVIEFVKTAKRVWRYCGDKSELKRRNKKKQQRSGIAFFLLAIYLIIPFFFVTKPLGWVLPIFSCITCIGQAILQILKMKPSEYELQYSHIPSFWKYAELDDNDIVCATKDKWWVIALRIVLWLSPIALGAEMLIFLEGFWKIAGYVMIILCSVLWLPFKDNTIYGYQLHFVDDKNDIEYHLLKDFMKRNNLQ